MAPSGFPTLIHAIIAGFAVVGAVMAVASGYLAALAATLHRDDPRRDAYVASAVNDGIADGFMLSVVPGLAALLYSLAEAPC